MGWGSGDRRNRPANSEVLDLPPAIVVVIASFSLLFVPFNFASQTLGGDSISYFSHATTLLFNGDLSYRGDLVENPPHPYGASLVFAAVAAPFSVVDRLVGHPIVEDRSLRDSSWTVYGMSFASLLAALGGFLLLQSTLENLRIAPRRRLLWVLVLGSGVGGVWSHFMLFASHAVEFLSISAVGWLATQRNVSSKFVSGLSLALPLSLAFVLMVRPSNVGVLLLPVCLRAMSSDQQGLPALNVRMVLWGSALAASVLAVVNRAFYGQVYPSIVATYDVDLFRAAPRPLEPVIAELSSDGVVAASLRGIDRALGIGAWYFERISQIPGFFRALLVSGEFGVLWWTPVLPIGLVAGLVLVLRRSSDSLLVRGVRALSVLVLFGVPLAIVFRWQMYGSGWGYRYLLPAFPFAVVATFRSMQHARRGTVRAVVAVLAISAAFSIISQVFLYSTETFRPVAGGINAFGRPSPYTFRTIGPDVLRGLVDATLWPTVIASRAPGFLGLLVLGEEFTSQLVQRLGLRGARYSVDDAFAIASALEGPIRWAYAAALLALPLIHVKAMVGGSDDSVLPQHCQEQSRCSGRRRTSGAAQDG